MSNAILSIAGCSISDPFAVRTPDRRAIGALMGSQFGELLTFVCSVSRYQPDICVIVLIRIFGAIADKGNSLSIR